MPSPDSTFSTFHILRLAVTLIVATAMFSIDVAAQGPAVVETVRIARRPIASSTSLIATVDADRRSRVAAEVAGVVTEILVREGDSVDKGQVVARLSRDLAASHLAAQKARVDQAQAELDELLAGTRDELKAQAQAEHREATRSRKREEKRLARMRDRFEKGVETEEALLDAELAQERAVLLEIRRKAAWDLARNGPRPQEISAARARLAAAGAEHKRLGDENAKRDIRAPFAGIVARRLTEVGEWLTTGATVCEILDLDRIEIVVPVPERHIGGVQIGGDVSVRFGAFPNDDALIAKIVRISPTATPGVRTVPVYVEADNRSRRYRAGISAEVVVEVGAPREAFVVPQDALFRRGGSEYLCTVAKNGTVAYAFVQTGRRAKGMVEVLGEVTAGTRVVVRGNERLYPGQHVVEAKRGDASKEKQASKTPRNGGDDGADH